MIAGFWVTVNSADLVVAEPFSLLKTARNRWPFSLRVVAAIEYVVVFAPAIVTHVLPPVEEVSHSTLVAPVAAAVKLAGWPASTVTLLGFWVIVGLASGCAPPRPPPAGRAEAVVQSAASISAARAIAAAARRRALLTLSLAPTGRPRSLLVPLIHPPASLLRLSRRPPSERPGAGRGIIGPDGSRG